MSDAYAAGSVTGLIAGDPVGLNGVRGRVLASDGTDTVIVTGDQYVAGVAGANYGLTNGSGFVGDVISPRNADSLALLNHATLNNLHSTASVAVGWYVGGVVGFNEGTVEDCSAAGRVTGISYVGGLVGGNQGTVTNSFWDIEASGITEGEWGISLRGDAMKDVNYYLAAGWDICAVARGEVNTACTWNIVQGETYPFLSWQPVS